MTRQPHVTPNGADDSAQLAAVLPDEDTTKRATTLVNFILSLVAIATVFFGVVLWMINAHAENPHPGAVSVEVFEARNQLEDERDERLEEKVDKIGEHLIGPAAWKQPTD